MRQTYAARQAVRAGTEPDHDKSRKGESGVRLRMVPAPRGVTFVEDKPAVEGDRKAHQSYEIENRREQPGSCHRTSDKAG
jgi:hypothetical protein